MTNEKSLSEKTVIANRLLASIKDELLTKGYLEIQINSTFGAAQSHYRNELKKSETKIDDWRKELEALGVVN
jgi:hypothetical protein